MRAGCGCGGDTNECIVAPGLVLNAAPCTYHDEATSVSVAINARSVGGLALEPHDTRQSLRRPIPESDGRLLLPFGNIGRNTWSDGRDAPSFALVGQVVSVLAIVVRIWTELPGAIRAGTVAMVNAASPVRAGVQDAIDLAALSPSTTAAGTYTVASSAAWTGGLRRSTRPCRPFWRTSTSEASPKRSCW